MSKCHRNMIVILFKNNFVHDGNLLHGQLEKNDPIPFNTETSTCHGEQ